MPCFSLRCTPTARRRVACGASSSRTRDGRQVVETYYESYNRRDIPALLDLFDPDVEYHDLAVYDEPFVGIDELSAYFDKIEKLVPRDIVFVVDAITTGDPDNVGVEWHVELESDNEGFVPLPFSRGVSFYKLRNGKIVSARDLVEPASKPGPAALGAISAIAPVIRKLGTRANPQNLRSRDGKDLVKAGAMYAFAVTYILLVLFSDALPGDPGIRVNAADLERILHESENFFYVNVWLKTVGLTPVPSIAEHPVDEGLFNLVSAWSLSFLPLMANDPKGQTVRFSTKRNLWTGIMFLTNFFAPWYMARRMVPDAYTSTPNDTDGTDGTDDPVPASLALDAIGTKVIAATSLVVGLVSLYWMVGARPELGGSLEQRWAFFVDQAQTNRVFWAFCLDAALYSVWQAWILKDMGAPGWQQRLPLFGTVGFLLSRTTESVGGGESRRKAQVSE